MEMPVADMDAIFTWAKALAIATGWVEDVDYEDTFELAELVTTTYDHPQYTSEQVFHALVCYTDECLCED